MIKAEESQLSGRKLKRLLRQGQGALAEAHQMWQNLMTCLQEPEGPNPFDQLLCTVANSKTPNCKFVHRLAKLLGPSTGKKQAKLVAEVYNPNRFSSRSKRHGLRAGEAFDLELGHDLTKETYRRTVREYLNKHKPGLVCISPPCTMLSMLQNLSFKFRESDPHKQREYHRRLMEAKLLLGFAVELCHMVQNMGVHFYLSIHGHPRPGRITA